MLIGTAFLMSQQSVAQRGQGRGQGRSARQLRHQAARPRAAASAPRHRQPVLGRPLPQPAPRPLRHRRLPRRRLQPGASIYVDSTTERPSRRALPEQLPPQPLGPTQGQFIDIYVRRSAGTVQQRIVDDPLHDRAMKRGSTQAASPDLRHVLKLERDVYGQPQLHTLPLTKGYYNGCLLTITSGPAAGQSTRIVDYEYIGDIQPSLPARQSIRMSHALVPLPRDGVSAQPTASRCKSTRRYALAGNCRPRRRDVHRQRPAVQRHGRGVQPAGCHGPARAQRAASCSQLAAANAVIGAEIALVAQRDVLQSFRLGCKQCGHEPRGRRPAIAS